LAWRPHRIRGDPAQVIRTAYHYALRGAGVAAPVGGGKSRMWRGVRKTPALVMLKRKAPTADAASAWS